MTDADLTRAVANSLLTVDSYIVEYASRGGKHGDIDLDTWFVEGVAREIGFNPIYIPGSYKAYRQFITAAPTLYFDEEKHFECFLSRSRTLVSSYAIARDITAVCDSLVRSLGYLDGKSSHTDSISSVFYWTTWAIQDRWVPVMKYHKDYLFVHYAPLTNREYPEKLSFDIGKPGAFCFGSKYRFLMRKLRDKNLVVLNSVLQGLKKGMLPVSDNYVYAAAAKHAKILSQDGGRLSAPFRRAIERTSREVFGIVGLEDIKVPENEILSSHGCTDNPRSQAGFNGQFLKETYGWMKDLIFGYIRDFSFNTEFVGYEVRKGLPIQELRIPCDLPYHTLVDRLNRAYTNEYPQPVRVKFILEPLKVRTISVGSYAAYSCQRPLQQYLWKRLQRFNQFILTGTPIDRGILQLIAAGSWSEDDLMVSGDYSSATDLLKMDATLFAMRSCLSGPVLKTALTALGPQFLQYYGPNWSCKDSLKDISRLPQSFLQANGQLMGSPLSFPFLCLINLAVYRLARESWDDCEYSLSDLRVLVNGDDIAFRGNWSFYQWWRWNIQQVGFQPSVGKNFTSRDFVNINSQYFRIEHTEKFSYCAEQVAYVNMGLITGRKKGDIEDGLNQSKEYTDLMVLADTKVQDFDELYSGHTEEMKNSLLCEWKLWRQPLLAKYNLSFNQGCLNIEAGPSRRINEHMINQMAHIKYGKIPMPRFCGNPTNMVMGSYWKAYCRFYDDDFVREQIDDAVNFNNRHHSKDLAVYPPEEEYDVKVSLEGTTWGVLRSEVVIGTRRDELAKIVGSDYSTGIRLTELNLLPSGF